MYGYITKYTKQHLKRARLLSRNKRIENVQPLRTNEDIQTMILAIRRGNGAYPKRPALAERDVLLFLIGINTGLRVSDIIKLKVEDVKNKDSFTIYEGKTQKKRTVNISMLTNEIHSFTETKADHEYLLKSQRGGHHITTTQVYRILQQAGKYIGRDDIGTHTMRKTFGYHHYKQFKNVAMLQEIFNHHAPSITMRYIGITEDEINETLDNFRLG